VGPQKRRDAKISPDGLRERHEIAGNGRLAADKLRCAPIPQYVITLSGVLEFTTVGGETFTIRRGDVLLAVDHTGSGHKWRLINDEPWKRAYVVFKQGADTHFVPDQT